MARKQFTLIYPDKSREHISRTERDSALLASTIRATADPLKFIYVGEARTYRNFAELGDLRGKLTRAAEQGPNYLPGKFVVEMGDSRYTERLESPNGMTLRLARDGKLQAA